MKLTRLVLALIVTAMSLTTSVLLTLIVFSAAGVHNSTRQGTLWLAWFVAAAGLVAGVVIVFADTIAPLESEE